MTWVRLLWNDGQLAQNQLVELIEVVAEADLEPGYGDNPGSSSGAKLLGLGDFRLDLEHGLRDLLEPLERGLELAELCGGRPVERRRLR